MISFNKNALIVGKCFLAAFLSATSLCVTFHYLGGIERPNWIEMHGALTGGMFGGLWFGYSFGRQEKDET